MNPCRCSSSIIELDNNTVSYKTANNYIQCFVCCKYLLPETFNHVNIVADLSSNIFPLNLFMHGVPHVLKAISPSEVPAW